MGGYGDKSQNDMDIMLMNTPPSNTGRSGKNFLI